MTKFHLMVRLQSWTLGNMEYPSLLLLSGTLWPGEVVLVRSPFMSQIELFNHLLEIIIISYLKPYNYMRIVHTRYEYLINRTIYVE